MSAAAAARRPDGRAILFGAAAAHVRPRKRVTVSQWADAHRVLSTKSSAEPGPWRTDRTPFLREPMDCLSVTSPIQTVVLRFPTQIGKTEVGLNWIGYVMHHAPAPMLYIMPTLDLRSRVVFQRIDPLIEETPVLAELFGPRRARDARNSESMKVFPGGVLFIGGANSPASLGSMPIKYLIADELDEYPWEVGKGDKAAGDPLGVLRQRLTSFGRRRKELLISTPLLKGASRIDEEFEATDQRFYNVPCPHCGGLLVFRWEMLRWNSSITEARYICEHCGAEIEERHKTEMLAAGRWVPKVENFALPKRGYALNALYAPIGLGHTWVELARMWVDANRDPTKIKLKRFVTKSLAEAWEDRSREVRSETLKQRAEPYGLREVPPGCLILTCGIDVQLDRLALQTVGWGRNQACWIIDWLELVGDPLEMMAKARAEEPGGPLYEYLVQPFVNRWGRVLHIEAAAIDTGYHTHDVYMLVRTLAANPKSRVRRLIAVKGSNEPGKPILGPRPQLQDVNWRGRLIKSGVKLWIVGTDTAKHALFGRLAGDARRLAEAAADENAPPPEVAIHFSRELPDDYYLQLTAEIFDPERNRWVKRRGRRNEALDTWVYAGAASQHPEIRVHAMRSVDWAKLERLLEPEGEPQLEAERAKLLSAVGGAIDGTSVPPRKKPPRKLPSGFGREGWNL